MCRLCIGHSQGRWHLAFNLNDGRLFSTGGTPRFENQQISHLLTRTRPSAMLAKTETSMPMQAGRAHLVSSFIHGWLKSASTASEALEHGHVSIQRTLQLCKPQRIIDDLTHAPSEALALFEEHCRPSSPEKIEAMQVCSALHTCPDRHPSG